MKYRFCARQLCMLMIQCCLCVTPIVSHSSCDSLFAILPTPIVVSFIGYIVIIASALGTCEFSISEVFSSIGLFNSLLLTLMGGAGDIHSIPGQHVAAVPRLECLSYSSLFFITNKCMSQQKTTVFHCSVIVYVAIWNTRFLPDSNACLWDNAAFVSQLLLVIARGTRFLQYYWVHLMCFFYRLNSNYSQCTWYLPIFHQWGV